MDQQKFRAPGQKHRMNAILHQWPEQHRRLVEALKSFGYGGCATNPPFQNGYTGNPDNLQKFGEILQSLREAGMEYWIYDEKGYPSGLGGGQTLGEPVKDPEEAQKRLFASHRQEMRYPELEAKGFYMVRRIAYETKQVQFLLDDQSDKIIWAAKYPLDTSQMNTSRVLYERMEPVPFTRTACSCQLRAGEVLFVFCVKPAYEGSHLTHNVSSRSRYINILDPRAVKRFLEVGYEPIAQALPEAYAEADAVFTDEPSLQTPYIHGDEVWPYALAPWVEGLFEDFEQKYGYSLLPVLPQIFEGRSVSYKTRVDFYELIGEKIAHSFVAQVRDWCHAHGTRFSGHYLAEESVCLHVLYYGSYLRVLEETDLQGCDVLAAHPGVYHYNTTRFAQMAARKRGRDGIMTELCPYMDMEVFRKAPTQNARGVINLLYLGGCRKINSYFSANFREYDPEQLGQYAGFMSREEARAINDYVARLGEMLEGAKNQCRTAVYYPLEDVQAKTRPLHCAPESADWETDRSLIGICRDIYRQGEDYLLVDRRDIVEMAAGCSRGCEKIENIILPAMDVIPSDAYQGLLELSRRGVRVWFCDKVPVYRADVSNPFRVYDFREESLGLNDIRCDENFTACSPSEICQKLRLLEQPWEPRACAKDTGEPLELIRARYEKDGKPVLFLVNNTLQDALVQMACEAPVTIWDPKDGSVTELGKQDTFSLDSYHGVFAVMG